jgi:hypothetical protein
MHKDNFTLPKALNLIEYECVLRYDAVHIV